MELNKLFTTLDTHAAGEPLRIITFGLPDIKGTTMLEKKEFFHRHLDHFRKMLMHEPRGHHGMYGCVMTPPVSEEADFGVLFMHNEGLSTMCGHGIIAVVTAGIETGMLNVTANKSRFVIDSPAGKIIAYAKCEGTEVHSVSFENVPSFVFAADVPIRIVDTECMVDIVFGGAFYAIVKASDLDAEVEINQLPRLKKLGTAIKEQIENKMSVQHPLEEGLKGIYGVIFSDQPQKVDSDLRNVTIFADEQVDRSPCGTGTCARMAALYDHGKLRVGESFVHESIIGSQFTGEILKVTDVAQYKGVVPQITGTSFITGTGQFVVDPSDPLAEGFLLA